MKIKKAAILIIKLMVVLLAITALYNCFMSWQYNSFRKSAESIEAAWKFDPDLGYNLDGGEPLLLVKPENKVSMIFMEGFRTQNPAGMYMDWFNELHTKHNVNIAVIVYGLQSSPFKLRYREWNPQEDLRTALQVYDAYTSMMPKNHRVVTVSQSFGTYPHAGILARSLHRPDAAVFLSPLNTKMEYRAAGDFVFWLSKQMNLLQHIIAFTKPAPSPNRVSVWDIVNPEKNKKMAERFPINPEDRSRHGVQVQETAALMESRLLPQIKGENILLVNGDSDLYFAQNGFSDIASLLTGNGNKVEHIVLKNSGHMVLADNGEDQLKAKILSILKGR
jgi:esterase/lipase